MHLTRSAALRAAFVSGLSAVLACGGVRDRSDPSARSDQADTVSPLFYTQLKSPDYSYSRIDLASEVDDAGTLYVLSGAYSTVFDNVVDAFDATGNHLYAADVIGFGSYGSEYSDLRVRGSTLALGGVRLTQNRDGNSQLGVGVLDPASGNTTATFVSDPGTYSLSSHAVDVCADGTVVAVAKTDDGLLHVFDVDPSGNLIWNVTAGAGAPTKVRCTGSGRILVAGINPSQFSFATQLESDGSQDWSWLSPDGNTFSDVVFDIDGSGNMVIAATVGGHFAVYSLDPTGACIYSWKSDLDKSALYGVAVDDAGNATTTGTRFTGFNGVMYTVRLDPGGTVLWAREDSTATSGVGVALDGAGNAFVCGYAGTALSYAAADGSTLWSYTQASFVSHSADVTNGVARCVGHFDDGQGGGLGVLAFAVP